MPLKSALLVMATLKCGSVAKYHRRITKLETSHLKTISQCMCVWHPCHLEAVSLPMTTSRDVSQSLSSRKMKRSNESSFKIFQSPGGFMVGQSWSMSPQGLEPALKYIVECVWAALVLKSWSDFDQSNTGSVSHPAVLNIYCSSRDSSTKKQTELSYCSYCACNSQSLVEN